MTDSLAELAPPTADAGHVGDSRAPKRLRMLWITAAWGGLAGRIKAAQDPEITQLTGFLTSFGQEMPSESSGMSHGGGHEVTGMMAEEEMAELAKASGSELEKLFLEMMIRHHEGAVAMATTELDDGQYAQAKALAEKIKAAQTTEIAEMKTLLTKYA